MSKNINRQPSWYHDLRAIFTSNEKLIPPGPRFYNSNFDHRSNPFLQPNSTACISYTWLRASATYISKKNADNRNSF